MKTKLLLAVLSIALVAGCSGDGGGLVSSKDIVYQEGVEIISINSHPDFVLEKDTIDVDLVIQNKGDQKANNIKANLFQLSDFELENSKATQEIESLDKPLPEYDIEGEQNVFFWTLRAPPIYDESQTRSVKARVTYDYESYASANTYTISKQEFVEKGEAAVKQEKTSTTGPVAVEIIAPEYKTISPDSPETQITFSVVLKNLGRGRVLDDLVKVDYIKNNGETQAISCEDYLVESGMTKLYGSNQERSIRCKAELDYNDATTSNIIEVGVSYTYWLDSNPLTIEIKEEL
jgi:hypothetical protein